MKMPVAVYVCYGLYVVYTGVYAYNRKHGKSAQFFTARVLPTNSDSYKLFTDICAGGSFLFAFVAILWKTFFL
jgi:hypothetical protein